MAVKVVAQRSCVVFVYRFFSPSPPPSIIFHWMMMMMMKNLARSFYILAKSRFFFFWQGRPLAWKSCGKVASLGVCIAKMALDIQQSTLPCTLPQGTRSPRSLALSVSLVHEYGRVFWTRRSHLVGTRRSWEAMIFLAVMLNCLRSVGA